jgi:site-specific recombinase XerD
MTSIRLKYVHSFPDRHGKLRFYFRRHGRRAPLRGLPGSVEFMEAYQMALASQPLSQTADIGSSRTKPGTINAAIVAYVRSVEFLKKSPSTQRNYRGVLNRFREAHGDKRVSTLEQRHLTRILAGMIETPEAANILVKVLRGLMAWCIDDGWRKDNPASGIKTIVTGSDGFAAWEQEHVDQYRAHHPLGTRARLALEILAATGLRRSDVVRLGRQHVKNGVISIKTMKTGAQVDIPMLPEMQGAIDAMPQLSAMTLLVTEYGKSFTTGGFGQWFRYRCDEAGIPKGYASHGLRKYAAARLAEEGAKAHQLMAWFGWSSLDEAEHYTRNADRKKMAMAAGALLIKGTA